MLKILNLLTVVLFFSVLATSPIQAKTGKAVTGEFSGKSIIVGGSGDNQAITRLLAKTLEQSLPGSTIEVPDSIGSSGGIKALIADKIDLARVARPLHDTEKAHGLTAQIFAKIPFVFAVHPIVQSIKTLSSEQIVAIYSGRIKNWQELGDVDHKIYAITREAGDSGLQVLLKVIPGLANISNTTTKTVYTVQDAVATLENHKYTIGFMPLSSLKDTKLQALKINGISPSPENIQNGSYNLVLSFSIVYKQTPAGLSKAFLDFTHSPEAQAIITEFGATPTTE